MEHGLPAAAHSTAASSVPAGPKEGVSVPFACPQELMPVEMGLPASNRTVTGLGIKRREVFAVAGSNAQGKTTFLEGIIAGMDDHAAGDGRELVVTVNGLCTAEAVNCELAGADVSMFFSALPPGMDGTARAACCMGSGSMTMACQVQGAVVRGAPLLIIDEDRAAPNLLVRSCLQTGEVTPLSEILAHDRGKIGDTALVFAACALDALVAQADRIMVLDRHMASAIDREVFRHRVRRRLRRWHGIWVERCLQGIFCMEMQAPLFLITEFKILVRCRGIGISFVMKIW